MGERTEAEKWEHRFWFMFAEVADGYALQSLCGIYQDDDDDAPEDALRQFDPDQSTADLVAAIDKAMEKTGWR